MKKFQFRLETLLKFRRMQEEQAQAKLAEATNRLRKEQELLSELQNKLSSNLSLLNEEQAKQPTVETLTMYSNYIDKIKKEITIQIDQVAKADSYRQECLTILEAAMKRRKLVEDLRKRRLEQYNNELMREEQKILDELGTQAFMRDKESD